MNTDDWGRLKALFNSALEKDGAERAAFLATACAEHPDLQEPLRELIASHADAAGFLEEPAFAAASLDADVLDPGDDPPGMLAVGDVLDDTYEVESIVGQGGMGVVYRVRHRALARAFAAKLVHSRVADNPAFLERFSREAEALGKLKHPHIVDVTDFGVDRSGTPRPYLILEHLQGQTLQERLRTGPLAPAEALSIFEAIAAALDHAHQHGVLHLDLKPGNVMLVDGPGGQCRPKILDFGLAQFLTQHADQPAAAQAVQPIGSPSYMAPEVVSGAQPGPSADIYALGVVMYEALSGHRPFDGSTAAILEQQLRATPPAASSVNAAIPREVDAALAEILAKNPADRPATALAAVALVREATLAAKQRLWRRAEIPRRLGAAAALAIALTLLAPLAWQRSILHRWEQQTVDARFAFAAQRPPGPDILMLMLDDRSLAADDTDLPRRADQFGADLQRVFDAGARAVAVDFLLPEKWNRSLLFAQLVLRHADRLTLAAFSTPAGEVVGPECISGMATVELGPERAAGLFGFINLEQDDDGVHRRGRLFYRDREGGARPSFAARVVSTARPDLRLPAGPEGFWIDHTIDGGRFDRVSWKDLDTALRTRPESFRNRLVIVGGDYTASGDEVRAPNIDAVAGVIVHALTIETILSGFPVRQPATAAVAGAAGIACGLLCAAILLGTSPRGVGVTAALAGVAYVAGAFLLFRFARVILPVVGPLLMLGVGAAVAWWIRLRRPAFPGA
jgi:CHASE2 domain-containing sensor protein/tRNA A-37 threonylcarbamoyl transferase component Bud32